MAREMARTRKIVFLKCDFQAPDGLGALVFGLGRTEDEDMENCLRELLGTQGTIL